MPLTNAGQRITAGLLSTNYAASDIGAVTVTAASLTDLTGTFTVPANDSQVANIYEIECWGNGTWGSSTQALTIQPVFAGQQVTSFILGANYMTSSTNFRFRFSAKVICLSTGSSGTFSSLLVGECSVFGTSLLPGTGANATGGMVSCESSGTYTVDTTASQGLKIQAQWASTTGAPTITKRAAIQRKLGIG